MDTRITTLMSVVTLPGTPDIDQSGKQVVLRRQQRNLGMVAQHGQVLDNLVRDPGTLPERILCHKIKQAGLKHVEGRLLYIIYLMSVFIQVIHGFLFSFGNLAFCRQGRM